jgi:site-specific DNA-adenine methylase
MESAVPNNQPDTLLVALDHQLDRAVLVVPRPRDNFASAVRAMQSGRYDTPIGRYDTPSHRFPRLEAHELLARDITAAVDAGAPDRESEFLKRVSVRLHAE